MVDKSMKNRIENECYLDKKGVWVLADRKKFNYSDGRPSELYLKKCFTEAKDLSSTSYELECLVKDWPSEYHLTRKRSQLFRGFDFDRSKNVLEVGCGCGAITRFLGETFDDIVSIEGSATRAELARLRTKGMENVSILNAPFQKIKFKERFDIIFCVGVFEYSNVFVDAVDPYDFVLEYFHDVLTDDGVLIIAIENQFGLKYFSSSREDHTNVMFDGLEGYPRYGNKTKTFGYNEIKFRIGKYFDNIDFYFPYPDYKIPSCILSEDFFNKVKAGELIGNFRSRDYINQEKALFDERLTLLELDKNDNLPFFSNSFLAIAGKDSIESLKFDQLGIIFSADRIPKLQTSTRFVEYDDGITADKMPAYHHDVVEVGSLTLRATQSQWIDGLSLEAQVLKRVKMRDITYEELFAPCQAWFNKLNDLSFRKDDSVFIDGKYVDCTWGNSFIQDSKCVFIDGEFEWDKPIKMNVIVIRAIFIFIDKISSMGDLNCNLYISSREVLINRIAAIFGVKIDKKDFMEFVDLEAEISHLVFGRSFAKNRVFIKFILWNEVVFSLFDKTVGKLRKIFKKVCRVIRYFLA